MNNTDNKDNLNKNLNNNDKNTNSNKSLNNANNNKNSHIDTKEEKENKNIFHERHHDDKKVKLLEEKNKLLEESLNQEKAKSMRIQAEMANIKRHKDEEISNLIKYEGEDMIKSLLPIIDNFERALSLENDENKEFLEGFRMIYNKLITIMDNNEVSVIDQKNVTFDPSIHQAVATEKVEGTDANMVLDILQKGYKYKDKLLRPAMVKVSE